MSTNMEVDVVFVTSLLSVFVSIFVLISYVRYQPDSPPTFLRLAIRLILADLVFSSIFLFWKITEVYAPSDNLQLYCLVFHPILLYCIVSGYGWTICIALRFREIPKVLSFPKLRMLQNFEIGETSTPYTLIVWGVSAFILLPVIILNTLGPNYEVSTVAYVSTTVGAQYCFFRTNWQAHLVNNICFQLPLIMTIGINSFAFVKGLYALGNAPQSVVARKMRHAGSYLFALLAIWVPNFIINLYLEIAPGVTSRQKSSGYAAIVVLSSIQGLLNCLVYVYSDHKFRQWVLEGRRASYSLLSHDEFSGYSIDDKQDRGLVTKLVGSDHEELEGGAEKNTADKDIGEEEDSETDGEGEGDEECPQLKSRNDSSGSGSSVDGSARRNSRTTSSSSIASKGSCTSSKTNVNYSPCEPASRGQPLQSVLSSSLKRSGRNSSTNNKSGIRSLLQNEERYVRFGKDEEYAFERTDTGSSAGEQAVKQEEASGT